MKKLLVVVLAIMLVCGGMMSASQATAQGPYEYRILADGTVEITHVSEDCADQVIPAELDGRAVSSIANDAFSGCLKLKDVVIPEGVTSVGNYAFGWCYNLTSVTIPDSVKSFGEGVFSYCMKMKDIRISREHPALAFNNGALIRKDDMTLLYVAGVKGPDYEIPWGIKRIGTCAFSYNKLRSVIIPDSVTAIGHSAFENCSSLTDVYIPGSVTIVDVQAFNSCSKLKKIRIPNSVTKIGEGAFDWCFSLESIELDPDHPVYEFRNGALILKEARELLCCAGGIKGVYEIPEGIEKISRMAFHGNKNLKEVIIPDGVTYIGSLAFCDCRNLTKVRLPDGLKAIESSTFAYSEKLKEVNIPGTVTKIGSYAFDGCKSLVSLVIPDSVSVIETNSFNRCEKLICTVGEESYAKQFCEKNNIHYIVAGN